MESRWIWPFELLDKLGEGGMGVVYRARYVRNDRHVAVKLLPEDAASNTTLLARFEREMEVLKQLDHPNIVHCFGGTCESEQRFYAMELIEGGTLADVIRHKGRLSWFASVDYAIQICSALAYAHDRGVIHRDLKPSNFLITKQGQLKLSDFGLVTVVSGRRLTAAGRTMGTADYMSPEQIRGKPGLTNRSDLYALGCVIHEMMTGRPPFMGENTVEVMHKHLKEPVPHIAQKVLDCPVELDLLVCELLSKTSERRPETAEIVGHRLEEILQPGRRASRVEPSLLPMSTSVRSSITSPLEGIPNSDSMPEIRITSTEVSSRWPWLVAILLLVVCQFCWRGWANSTARIKLAENVLADELTAQDMSTQVFAAHTLSKFGTLQSRTIDQLHVAAKSKTDAVAVAALDALAHHPNDCRSFQWDIYKLQQNSDVSSAIRYQAGRTFEEIQKSRPRSFRGSTTFWILTATVVALAATGAWWVWNRAKSIPAGYAASTR